ncbi:hypothetical protein GEMRC1_006976 [Eukaryota sp. GEM-RC1]
MDSLFNTETDILSSENHHLFLNVVSDSSSVADFLQTLSTSIITAKQTHNIDQLHRCLSLLILYLHQTSKPPQAVKLPSANYNDVLSATISVLSLDPTDKTNLRVLSQATAILSLFPALFSFDSSFIHSLDSLLLSDLPISKLPAPCRASFLTFIDSIISKSLNDVEPTTISSLLVSYFAHETDPRCLSPLFSLISNLDPILPSVPQLHVMSLFELLTSYFPLTYQPPKDLASQGITHSSLRESLLKALSCSYDLAIHSFPFAIEVFSSEEEEISLNDSLQLLKLIADYQPSVYERKVASLSQSKSDNSSLISTLMKRTSIPTILKVLQRLYHSFLSVCCRNTLEGVGLAISSEKEEAGAVLRDCYRNCIKQTFSNRDVIGIDDVLMSSVDSVLHVILSCLGDVDSGGVEDLPHTTRTDCAILAVFVLKGIIEGHQFSIDLIENTAGLISKTYTRPLFYLTESLLSDDDTNAQKGKVSRMGKISGLSLIGLLFSFQSNHDVMDLCRQKFAYFMNTLSCNFNNDDHGIKFAAITTCCVLAKLQYFEPNISEFFNISCEFLSGVQMSTTADQYNIDLIKRHLFTVACFSPNILNIYSSFLSLAFDGNLDWLVTAITECLCVFGQRKSFQISEDSCSELLKIVETLANQNECGLIFEVLQCFVDNSEHCDVSVSFCHSVSKYLTNLKNLHVIKIIDLLLPWLPASDLFNAILAEVTYHIETQNIQNYLNFYSNYFRSFEHDFFEIIPYLSIISKLATISNDVQASALTSYISSAIQNFEQFSNTTNIFVVYSLLLGFSHKNQSDITPSIRSLARKVINESMAVKNPCLPSLIGYVSKFGGDMMKTIIRNSFIMKVCESIISNKSDSCTQLNHLFGLLTCAVQNGVSPSIHSSKFLNVLPILIAKTFGSSNQAVPRDSDSVIGQSICVEIISSIYNLSDDLKMFINKLIENVMVKSFGQIFYFSITTAHETSCFSNSSVVRFRFVQCLSFCVKSLSPVLLLKHKKSVIQALVPLLDDCNRMVRAEAMNCRHLWSILKISEN